MLLEEKKSIVPVFADNDPDIASESKADFLILWLISVQDYKVVCYYAAAINIIYF